MRLNSDLVETMSKQNNAKKSSIWGGRFKRAVATDAGYQCINQL